MRLIYVVGTPSGGTSCVAGILHHLGVDMGSFPRNKEGTAYRPGIRGYTVFEDTQTDKFKVAPDGKSELVVRQRLKFREYIAFRAAMADSKRIGLKGSPLWWFGDPQPETLPIDTIRVRRPIEDSIRSDWHYQIKINAERPDLNRRPMDDAQHLRRAEAIAACWAGCELLTRIHPPRADLQFYDVLARPAWAVTYLCEALELKPSDRQVRQALAFVDPAKRRI